MRNRLLGTIAAVATGAAWGATPVRAEPPPPVPIGVVGGMSAGGIDPVPAQGPAGPAYGGAPGVDPSALFPGGGPMGPMGPVGPYGPGMGGPGMGGPGMGGPGMGGMPGYPPGYNGDQMWAPPFTKGSLATDSTTTRTAPRLWVDTDYLLWFAKAQPVAIPFVTSGAPGGGGIPGSVGTTTLYSNSDLGFNVSSGFRVTAGYFKDDDRRFGYYASGFATEWKSDSFYATSDGTGQPLLARPFADASNGNATNVLLVSFPTVATGNVHVYASNQTWGVEGGPMLNLFRSCPDSCWQWNVNGMLGFRFAQLHETLETDQSTTLIGNATAPFDGKLYGAGTNIGVTDSFDTLNRFYGGQGALNIETQYKRFIFSFTGKIALGVMHETVDINGYSTLLTASTMSTVPGGLFANGTNIGKYSHDEFAVIPEVNGKIGYAWTSWLSTTVGYSFMYFSRVVRPTDQYSSSVNPAFVPTSPSYGTGAAAPVPNQLFTQSSYWLQGVTFGVNLRY
ncbi:BBP7 family outer membrane beta-barrel protein [Fimbriiglobus ruber]|uniref:Uncharacterized protein n=1 Tax=Fimbriiglobus ruber TaxID=1908690 RepID=A0A225DUR8_9BACT|nr:BBP7 family outer membrane beta-barrel protein [Fimbriiglobus ruber]OWK45260.1 hypothetical protein FRUB_01591 [Fimbriiglobus ruber]